MKNSNKIVALLLVLCAFLAEAQAQEKLKQYSAGLRMANLYDLASNRYDSELSQDPKGLNGANTSFDIGMDIYGEVMVNPLIGFQAGLRFGGTSGSTDVEYYDNSFQEFYTDMTLLLGNLDKRFAHNPFNYYAKLGLGYGRYSAERYLLADHTFNGGVESGFVDGHIGAGVQYELNRYLRVELDASYNVAMDDGFDGFDHGRGNDSYFSTGIGVAYTFGDREKERPMYSVGLLSQAYMGTTGPDAETLAVRDSLGRHIENLNQSLQQLSEKFDEVSEEMTEQKKDIEKQSRRLEQQEKLILKLRSASAKTEEANVEPVTTWQKDLQQVQVYFEFDSDALTPETQAILSEALTGDFERVTLIGYASSEGKQEYNEELKVRRVNNVRDYLVETMKIDPTKLEELAAGTAGYLGEEDYLNRKVEVKYYAASTR